MTHATATHPRTATTARFQPIAHGEHTPLPRSVGRALASQLGYPQASLAAAPALAVDSFAGVGHHLQLAALRSGERVVDLACGAGLDSFIAAGQVGPTGHVHGIEPVAALRQKAVALRDAAGLAQVSLHGASPTALPVPDASIDCVMGNGATATLLDRKRAFAEAARVLRPGGRLVLSDLVSASRVPTDIARDAYACAAGIGNAMHRKAYQELLATAGFSIQFVQLNDYRYPNGRSRQLAAQLDVRSISLVAARN